MIMRLPLTMNRQGGNNGLLLPLCPHLFAYKVEEASRLVAVKDQRRDAAATFPVLHGVTLAPPVPECSGLQTIAADCTQLHLIALN